MIDRSVDRMRRAAVMTFGAASCAAFFAPASPWAASRAPRSLTLHLDDLPPGQPRRFEWNGAPYAVVRTTDAMLADLRAHTVHTWNQREIPDERPALFVYSLLSPVFGCIVEHAPPGTPRYAPEREWQGGFYDPCHFAEWDYAGRAVRQYPDQEPTMRVPDLDVPAFETNSAGTVLRLQARP